MPWAEAELPEGHFLTVWVVTSGASDLARFGKRYALRAQFLVRPKIGTGQVILAGKEVWLRDTLDEIRAIIPPGLDRMPHQEGEDPVIVESWL